MEENNKDKKHCCVGAMKKHKCIMLLFMAFTLIFVFVAVSKKQHRYGYYDKGNGYAQKMCGEHRMDKRGMRKDRDMGMYRMEDGRERMDGRKMGMHDRGGRGMMMHLENAGPDSMAAREAMMLTKWAMRLYDVVGHNEAIELLGSDAAVFGEQYVFVIDARDGMVLANPFAQDLVATDVRTRSDATGKPYGRMIADASPRGEWVSYIFRSPPDNNERQKYTYVINYNGLIFGSGYYTE